MLKYYITVLLKQLKKSLNQFFFTYLVQTKIWKLGCTCLIWAIERIKAVLRYFH